MTQMRRAYAQSKAESQQAEEEGLALRDRVRSSYPFHPALIDLMRERWAAIPDFQRTRGALRARLWRRTCTRLPIRLERITASGAAIGLSTLIGSGLPASWGPT